MHDLDLTQFDEIIGRKWNTEPDSPFLIKEGERTVAVAIWDGKTETKSDWETIAKLLPNIPLLLEECKRLSSENEPLLTRIAELEDLLARISDVEPRLKVDSTNDEDRDVFYEAVDRFRLSIKGAQDV